MSIKKCTDEELVRDYLDERMLIKDIAKKYGYSNYRCVTHRLRNLGIETRKHILFDENLSDDQVDMINGSLLGDAYGRLKGSGAYIKFAHSSKQKEYVKWKREIMLPFTCPLHSYKSSDESFSDLESSEFVTPILPQFIPFIERFYPEKTKVVPRDIDLSPLGLATWFMDDGGIDKNWNRINFSTCSFSDEEQYFLLDFLKNKFDLNGNVVKSSRKYKIIVLSAHSFDRFKKIVHPYLIPSMLYKINC